MNADVRALLLQVSTGLEAIADACDRLLDLEVAASASWVADRLQIAIDGLLSGAPADVAVAGLSEAIAELQSLLSDREGHS
ncbi:MAG TPA: hypothetical protein VGR62_15550 [Candidatus Binatia bacterium]|jgi:hypothetical protein|nr:hypothetical protein [Candidatus Binatia bacterium]